MLKIFKQIVTRRFFLKLFGLWAFTFGFLRITKAGNKVMAGNSIPKKNKADTPNLGCDQDGYSRTVPLSKTHEKRLNLWGEYRISLDPMILSF